MRKRGMGKDPLGWIGEGGEAPRTKETHPSHTPTRPPAAQASAELPEAPPETPPSTQSAPVAALQLGESTTSALPKYATLIPITARLTEDQVDYLETMERRIMRSRQRRHERITKNTIIRAAIELVRALPWDYNDIADESELIQRLLTAAGLSASS